MINDTKKLLQQLHLSLEVRNFECNCCLVEGLIETVLLKAA